MAMICRVAMLLAAARAAAAGSEVLRGSVRANSSAESRRLGALDGRFVLSHKYNLASDPKGEFDVIVIPDQNLTHSCSDYVDDGSTVFSRDGKLVLKVASACPDGRCVRSGRVMSRESYKYGVFALRAKVPKCNGLWPALWMLPGNTNGTGLYGDWPCSGEIDILETTGGGSVGTFNLVAGYGSQQGCGGEPVCNKCGRLGPYCTSTTLEHLQESFYEVESVDCSAERPSWKEHLFVLNWQPGRVSVYVDPEMRYDQAGRLVGLAPKPRTGGRPTWKEYRHDSTPTWSAVSGFMNKCHPESTPGAPFDQPMKLVLNIAVGGYGGSPCRWGQQSCSAAGACGGAVGSEMEVSDISVYEFEQ